MQHFTRTAATRLAVLALAALSSTVFAADVPPPVNVVPEPGTWSLVGLGLVVAVLIARKGRK